MIDNEVSNSLNTERNTRPWHLLCISADTKGELKSNVLKHANSLRKNKISLKEYCIEAHCNYVPKASRLAFRTKDTGHLLSLMEAYADGNITGEISPYVYENRQNVDTIPKVAFLFSGQGVYHQGMGRDFYNGSTVFKKTVDKCEEVLKPYMDLPLSHILFDKFGQDYPMFQTGIAQPAIYSFCAALFHLWRSLGIEPFAIMGQSLGEYCAAHAAEALSLEDGLRIVAERGRLMQSLPQDWRLVAVFSTPEESRGALASMGERIEISGYSGARMTLVGVRIKDEEVLFKALQSDNVNFAKVDVSHAFHTSQLDPILDDFERIAEEIPMSQPKIPLVSNFSGTVFGEETTICASYWRKHMRATVKLNAGIEALLELGCDTFLEISPSPFVLRVAKEITKGTDGITLLSSMQRLEGEWDVFLDAAAKLFVLGAPLNPRNLYDSLE